MATPEFDDFAQDYDKIVDGCLGGNAGTSAVEYFAEGKALYLQRLLGKDFKGTILDYGCGHGRVARHLLKVFPKAQIHGFDISTQTIAATDKALRQQVLFTSSESDLLPAYDLIILAGVLHHVQPNERRTFMATLAGRLAPEGRLTVFEHNPRNPLTRRVVANCIIDRGVVLSCPADTQAVMATANLRAASLEYISFIPPALRALRGLERFLAYCPLGGQYVMVGVHSSITSRPEYP